MVSRLVAVTTISSMPLPASAVAAVCAAVLCACASPGAAMVAMMAPPTISWRRRIVPIVMRYPSACCEVPVAGQFGSVPFCRSAIEPALGYIEAFTTLACLCRY